MESFIYNFFPFADKLQVEASSVNVIILSRFSNCECASRSFLLHLLSILSIVKHELQVWCAAATGGAGSGLSSPHQSWYPVTSSCGPLTPATEGWSADKNFQNIKNGLKLCDTNQDVLYDLYCL